MRSLRVAEVRDEAVDVRSYRLVDPNGAPLPAFEPGAHLSIDIDVNGALLRRHYSLVSPPEDRHGYRIAVLNAPQSRGASRYLHQHIHLGDRLAVSEPAPDFRLDPGSGSAILVAGGIGITPLLSMLRALVRDSRPAELHYVARSTQHMAFLAECMDLAGPCLRLYEGRASFEADRIHRQASVDAHVYVCGPRSLVETMRQSAARCGRPAGHTHFESFGAAPSSDRRPLRVQLARSGLDVEVPVDRTILDVLIDEGAFVSYDCKRGECGSCAATVLQGRPVHRDVCLDEAARATIMCPCVSWAEDGPLVLDL